MRAGDRDQEGLTLWQTVVSTAAAMFGVQKNENRIRDFSKGKPHQFIIAGLIGTALFVLVVVLVVQVVMRVAGQ